MRMVHIVVVVAGLVLAGRGAGEAPSGAIGMSDLPLTAQAQVSASLGRALPRYHAMQRAGVLRMENPRHRLSADFSRASIQIRTGATAWGLSLLSAGYGDDSTAVIPVEPHAAANRVEYRRGDLTEWYVNGPLGLEQGFTFAKAPGVRADAPLTLSFGLSGDLVAAVDETGRGAILTRADEGAALRYGGLTAFDATGRELHAWVEIDGERLSLRVDDRDAHYPVVVDPFIQQAKLTAPDGAAGDRFGAVALDGDTIVVGARLDDVGANTDQGSAYVFAKPAGGWSEPVGEPARLIASDGAAADVLGAVAVSGDTIVVGATGCPDPNVCNTQPVAAHGAAYVFVRPAGGWSGTLTEQAKLVASDGAPNDVFGASVDVQGDMIVVSSEWDDLFRGSAYVFLKPTQGWSGALTENARLIASDRGPIGSGIGQAFGRARIAGDVIVAGALGADVLGSDGLNRVDAGAAYVFAKPAAGWNGILGHSAKLLASDRAANDRFGATVDANDDTIVIGAPFDDVAGADGVNRVDAGSAYIFAKPAAGWSGTLTQQAKLIASDRAASDNFAGPLHLDDETVTAGAPLKDSGAGADTGAVYRFTRPSSGWSGTLTESEKLTASDGAANDRFGGALAQRGTAANAGADQTVSEEAIVTLDGTASMGPLLVVAAALDDIGANADQGSAYLFAAELAIDWQQLAGPAVVLDDATSASPSFTAPQLPGGFGSQVLTLQLTVAADGESRTDTVDVTVVNVNRAPVAEAGGDQTVNEGSPVSLDGSASFDPDGDAVTHLWTQIGGPPVVLTGADTATPAFTAPLIAGGVDSVATLDFQLTVSDGVLAGADFVQVVVEQVNHAPVADAGIDQTVDEGVLVTLDGHASSDPDGDPIAYAWRQLSGLPVTLSDAAGAAPSFVAPVTGPGGATLVFELTVSDGLLGSEPAAGEPDERVTVNVVNVNDPPLCSAGRASPALLWPPNHKMVQVGITGLADSNDDRLQIAVIGVTQDEPVNGIGDGDTSPDAVIQGDTVLLRAERLGGGNGRIYRVDFIAFDDQGGSCASSVDVAVPPSMKPGRVSADDGQLYDATSP
jgi:hypothetical protein